MRRTRCASLLWLATLAALGLALPGGAIAAKNRPSVGEGPLDVLVFSRTTGFRHPSIPAGVAAIRELGAENGFGVVATEEPDAFTLENLRRFEAIVFLNTTGTVLAEPQKRAMMKYVRRGGGYVGIHSAADTEYDWPFYGKLVGAWFLSHPLEQFGEIIRERRKHPTTRHLPERFELFEEFYSFKTNPRPKVRVLLSIDESSYDQDPNTTHLPGGTPTSGVMGDHPMSWCHDAFPGRAFYTALGHEPYLYELDWYKKHLLGGIRTATRDAKTRCRPRRDG